MGRRLKKRWEELKALKEKKEKKDAGLPVVRPDTIPGRPGTRWQAARPQASPRRWSGDAATGPA